MCYDPNGIGGRPAPCDTPLEDLTDPACLLQRVGQAIVQSCSCCHDPDEEAGREAAVTDLYRVSEENGWNCWWM